MFEWSEETRQKLHFVRPDAPDVFATDAWRACCGYAEMMQPSGEAPFQALAMSVVDEMLDDLVPSSLDVEREITRYAAISYFYDGSVYSNYDMWEPTRAVVAFWFHAAGPEFVLKLLHHSPMFQVSERDANPHFKGTKLVLPCPYVMQTRMQPLWWAIRLYTDRMPQAEFDAYRAGALDSLATELPDNSQSHEWFFRTALLYTLARDEELVCSKLAEMKATRGDLWSGIELAYLSAPLEFAKTLVANAAPDPMRSHAWDLLEHFGVEDGRAFLQYFVDTAKSANDPYEQDYAEAQKVLDAM